MSTITDPLSPIRKKCRAMLMAGDPIKDVEAIIVNDLEQLLEYYGKEENAEERQTVMEHVARKMAESMSYTTMGWVRRNSWKGVHPPVSTSKDTDTSPNQPTVSGQDLLNIADHLLLDFRLPKTGVLLRNATKDEISEAANYYASRASDASHKSRWLFAVAEELDKGTTLSEDLVRKLQDETQI